jgi:hypothetical protein
MNFYNTKLVITVDVSTQFGPTDAVNLIRNALNFPAIKYASITGITSDYLPQSEKEDNYKTLYNIPLPIK